jgi:hypothetical protein
MKICVILIALAIILSSSINFAQNVDLIGRFPTSGWAKGVFVSGDYAYVSCWTEGLYIINISNPANPSFAAHISTAPGQAWDTHVRGNYAYVADDLNGGLQIINISDPYHPFLAGNYDTPGWAFNLFVDTNFVYMADGYTGSLQIINISDPTNPTFISHFDTHGWARGIFIENARAYIANGTAGLAIVDVSDPANPQLLGSCCNDPYRSAIAVSVSGSYAYLADYDRVLILNITIPDSITTAYAYSVSINPWDVFVAANYLYISNAEWGLRILDISNPSSPVFSGSYNTPGAAWHVFVDNYIYVADSSSLMILQFNPTGIDNENPSPGRFALMKNYPNPFNATTSIDLALAHNGIVNLSIYNLLGQKVATPLDGFENAGDKSINWDASSLPSGVYFARLNTGGQVQSIKMVLLK